MYRTAGGSVAPMKIDREKIQKYLQEIKARHWEIGELMKEKTDGEILQEPWTLKGLKYALIEPLRPWQGCFSISWPRNRGEPAVGYIDTIIRAGETKIIPEALSKKLRPSFDFKNALIHRYWVISDEKLLPLVRENKDDFDDFVEAIETYLKNRSNLPNRHTTT